MPITESVLAVAICLSAMCSALVVPAILDSGVSAIRRVYVRAKLIGRKQEARSGIRAILQVVFSDYCRNGISVLHPVARQLLRVAAVRRRCEAAAQALLVKNQVCSAAIACELLIALFLAGLLFGLMAFGDLLAAIILASALIRIPLGRVTKLQRGWEEKFRGQIPDALRSLGVCLSAGLSMQQAFEQTARDTPEPLGSEFALVNFDIIAGRSLEESLRLLEQRTNTADLRFVIVALEIQHQTGGSMQEILESAANSILSSLDLRRALAVQTAQARLSAKIVTLMPLVLVLLLSLIMDGYLESFFSSPEGLFLLLTALTMQVFGVLIVRRILGLKLN